MKRNELFSTARHCSCIVLKATLLFLFSCTAFLLPANLYGVGSTVRNVPQQSGTISGTVTDEAREPLAGVTVMLKSTSKSDRPVANSTDVDGKYLFTGLKAGDRLVFTFIGMEPYEVVIKSGQTLYNVTMRYSENQLNEVIVETGIFQRDRASFTGATTSFTGTDLKAIGNQNVLESLKVLDPSFVIIDNLEMGANPNAVSTIELRGQGSTTINAITDEFSADPNQPLFVINGVEASLSRVKDLDINRIESITTLKDAGSTAIYGSKGANGVIVIETVKPKPGELKLYYNGDYGVQTPDLSVYNLMNAAEKLEFERLSGKYIADAWAGQQFADYQKALTELYNHRLAEVRRGVDTYWLSEPVRTAFTHGHSLRVTGGDQSLSFDLGGKYKIQEGVMKQSGRDTWGGDISITYRSGKLTVSNALDISGYTANESPYGDFSDWAKASPYFRKTNAEGGIDKFLQRRDEGDFKGLLSPVVTNVPNPLYNAMLNNKDQTGELYLLNNFYIQYRPDEYIRFRAGADLSAVRTHTDRFTAPEHTKYYDRSIYYQGEFYGRNSKSNSYRGYTDVSFVRMFGLHSTTFFARGELKQVKSDYTTVEAVGFPYGSMGTPNLAHSYREGSSPGYSLSDRRTVGLVTTFNYNYDKRFLFDVSYRIDGATTFGSNKLYKSFWSAGIGWNIDREAFMKDHKWVERLKLRATTGISGNQNQGSSVSETVYQYYLTGNLFGQGIIISDFANPNLPWQLAKDRGVGADFRAWKGRVSLTLDYYDSKTDPNIIFVPQVPSTGVDRYPMGIGHLTKKGCEFVVSAYPVYNLKDRIMWGIRITGLHSKSTYGGLGKGLDIFNERQRKDNTLVQFRDGYSPADIWAVRSYGIDPADGTEVFIKKNGQLTKEYSADEMVVVGNTRPDLIGVVSTSLRYKDFSLNVAFRYSFGSDIYNSALYNKVENITKEALQYNQDKRALYDRWKNIGDVTGFKSISVVSDLSPKTSRFVQKNDYLNAESISLSYELNDNEWVKNNLSARNIRITGYLNDIFRLETSKTERGINYPFARSVSLGLHISF